MRYSLLLTFLCFYAPQLRAQTIEPGYLVLSSGDTLRGEVENAFWEDPPASVRFRATSAASLTAYSATDLNSVKLTSGRLLRQETLPLDRSAETALPALTSSKLRYQKQERILADVLVEGPAMLLGVTLHNVHHFFVRREAQPYIEMTERNYLVQRGGRTVITDANDYTSQLLRYFGDCSAATDLLPKTSFTAAGLTRVVQAYNQQCSALRRAGQEFQEPVVSSARSVLRLGVLAGARYNFVRLTDGPDRFLSDRNLDGKAHALVGAYADVVNGGRRLALHAAIQVSRFGRTQPVSFQYQSLAGSLTWHGTLVGIQTGLRGFVPLGAKNSLLLGAGCEFNSYWMTTSQLTYAGVTGSFIHGLGGNLLPYLELGLLQDRWTVSLNGRIYDASSLAPADINIWSLSTGLSYRLNANHDQRQPTKP